MATKEPAAGPGAHETGRTAERSESGLRACAQRSRGLGAVWALLEGFDAAAHVPHVPKTLGAALADLEALAAVPPAQRDTGRLLELEKLLDAVEQELCDLAFEIPVPQLRAAIAGRAARPRRALLHLLDVMLLPELHGHDGWAGRFSAIDLVITLLAAGPAGGEGNEEEVHSDPVGLTERLAGLCDRAAREMPDADVAAAAAAFDEATASGSGQAPDEARIQPLRRRKRELGRMFFAPAILRAVVGYNAALSRALARGAYDSREFGSTSGGPGGVRDDASVFASDALPRLGASLARRLAGGPSGANAIDRIVSALDLESLDATAREALLAPDVGRSSNVVGTAVLVGLLCRASHILDGEFPAVGLSPSLLATDWVREVDAALKQELNRRILNDGYESAQLLSQLRNTFLYTLITDEHRQQRRPVPAAPPADGQFSAVNREARDITRQAKAGEEIARNAPGSRWQRIPWPGLGRSALALGVAALAGWAAWQLFFGSAFDGMSRSELAALSPLLADGGRNADGLGTAFVGTVTERWGELAEEQRRNEAAAIAAALREAGVRDIMIYDRSGRVRIQALGERAARIFPSAPARPGPGSGPADPETDTPTD